MHQTAKARQHWLTGLVFIETGCAPASVEAAGIELRLKSSGNQGGGGRSGAESGARDAQKADVTPDLASVVEAWPKLPEAIRAGILAMIRAAQ